ncbi:MAG: transcriptional repressor LexA [Acidobacteria bacterium]|nr:transcriptional repressor LexA [Acidobacteriota bacterium]
MNLTRRQRQILDFIEGFVERNGYSPSLEEIAHQFDITSVNAVFKHLAALEKRGCIHRATNQARSIQLLNRSQSVELPLLGYVAAGSPIEAVENSETISVPEDFVSHRQKNYVLRVRGNSMIDQHIEDGDYVIVVQRKMANNGETVVALVDNESVTLKRFYREEGRIRLQPSNPEFEPMILDADRVQIQGVVIGVLRKYR